MEKQRLDKLISSATEFSRKDVRGLVKGGRVFVDGTPAVSADQKVLPLSSEILVDGQPIRFRTARYFMMNKPAGVVSATEDRSEKTAIDLLRPEDGRAGVFPAGRLDKDAEGLLLLTDDGDFCHNVISPAKHVFKRYYVETDGRLTESNREAFRSGVQLRDGTVCAPGFLEITGDKCGYVRIAEGKYHQVKRMLASLGKPVTYLKRVSIGGLELDPKLGPGEYRELTEAELDLVTGNG